MKRTERGLKLRMPESSGYCDYSYWIPMKLFKDGNKVVLPENFIVKISKSERIGGVIERVDEKEIGADYLRKHVYSGDDTTRYVEVVPKKIEPIKNPKADFSLCR